MFWGGIIALVLSGCEERELSPQPSITNRYTAQQNNLPMDGVAVEVDQACIDSYQECMISGAPPEDCDAQFAECLTIPSDTPDPTNPMDELLDCSQSYDDCIASGRPEDECLDMSTLCGSPDCEALLGTCLDLGGSDEECSAQYEDCTGSLLPPEEEPPTNVDVPVEETPIEETPVEENPVEELPSEEPPVDIPTEAPPSDPEVSPSTDCTDAFDSCIAAGTDVFLCDEELATCLTTPPSDTSPELPVDETLPEQPEEPIQPVIPSDPIDNSEQPEGPCSTTYNACVEDNFYPEICVLNYQECKGEDIPADTWCTVLTDICLEQADANIDCDSFYEECMQEAQTVY